MYDAILVPVDGSECALQALDRAVDLAATYDATLHVVTVADVRITFGGSEFDFDAAHVLEYAEQRGEHVIDEALDRLDDLDTDLPTESAVVTGIPDEEILSYAEDNGIDVIVMGTHGRSGLDRVLLGSVTERVIRRSPVPVLTVRT